MKYQHIISYLGEVKLLKIINYYYMMLFKHGGQYCPVDSRCRIGLYVNVYKFSRKQFESEITISKICVIRIY